MVCCYKGTLEEFQGIDKKAWIDKMKSSFSKISSLELGDLQISAWEDCYDHLIRAIRHIENKQLGIVFEYVLPHEGGRRPDVIILSDNKILILEFKMRDRFKQEDIDQVNGYKRDIESYHKESAEIEVLPMLIPTKSSQKSGEFNNVKVYTPDLLGYAINDLKLKASKIDINKWLNSKYEPLPSLVQSAKKIFNKEPLPFIKKANSAGIPQAIEYMKSISLEAKMNDKRVLALVTGVPGAGKTLLGLKYVYESSDDQKKDSVFLSGNGPLVKVIQYAVKSKTFVQPLHSYVDYYGLNVGKPDSHIVVFDEAQRAWDRTQMEERRRISKSEPEILIQIGERIADWTVQLGLIGEGQEIYKGEEAGIVQWKSAIEKSLLNWEVHCPSKLEYLFRDICEVKTTDLLDLNVSLRSHIAEDVSSWASEIIDSNIVKAKGYAEKAKEAGFLVYVTRNLDRAKNYCRRRYEGELDKRYGLIRSSQDRSLKKYGVYTPYEQSKSMRIGKWFNDDVLSKQSCCRLEQEITEFQCQGLELDLPILCWGDDLIWEKDEWKKYEKTRVGIRDPHRLRLNSYRVLLTRGRDGIIIFVPDSRFYDDTYRKIREAGAEKL